MKGEVEADLVGKSKHKKKKKVDQVNRLMKSSGLSIQRKKIFTFL